MVIDLPDGSRRGAGELARALIIIRPGRKLVYAADMAHEDKAHATQHSPP